jgi:hypothetical protein
MTGREKNESFSVILDGLLQVLHLSQLVESSKNGVSEVIERWGAIWMAGRTKSDCVIEVRNGLLQVVHSSQLLKAFEKSERQVSQQISVLDIPQGTPLKAVSMLRHCPV